ncbi:hypothetical protein, partial [Bradyrhizobium liaoningense]
TAGARRHATPRPAARVACAVKYALTNIRPADRRTCNYMLLMVLVMMFTIISKDVAIVAIGWKFHLALPLSSFA